MNATRRRLFAAALALLVLVNAVTLGGAAWNRASVDSRLALSDRELTRNWHSVPGDEDSSVRLSLQWRVRPRTVAPWLGPSPTGLYQQPAWLDEARMLALGFAARPAADKPRPAWHQTLPERREVLLVLELAGPAWREAQAAAQLQAANAADHPVMNGRTPAQQILEREAQASRLFAVDAGLDRDALRRAWPDRAHHAIVHARIERLEDWQGHEVTGRIIQVENDSVMVPLPLRRQLEALAARPAAAGASPADRAGGSTAGTSAFDAQAFSATLAFGRRLEPWLESVGPRAPD